MAEAGPTPEQRRTLYIVLSALLVLIVALNVVVFLRARSSPPPRPTIPVSLSPQPTPASPSPTPAGTTPATPTRPVTPPPTLPRHTATPWRTTAVPTPTRTRTPTLTPTATTPVTPTATPTISPTATLTPTPTPSPFPTWTPTASLPTATPEPTRTPGPISPSASRVTAEPTDSPWRWGIRVQVIDIYGLPAAGVQVTLSFVPASAPVVVEDPPPTDASGTAVGYVQSEQAVCVIVEARVGNVTLLEKPTVCFGP